MIDSNDEEPQIDKEINITQSLGKANIYLGEIFNDGPTLSPPQVSQA